MSLKARFFLYLAFIHIVFAAATVPFLRHHRIWLSAAEVFFAISFLLGWQLMRRLNEPTDVLRTSLNLLESGDFMTRFREVGRPEVDRFVRLYNRLVDRLRDERVLNQEQDSLLRRIIETSPSGMIALDFDDRIQSLNPGAEEILELAQAAVRGKTLAEVAGAPARELESLAVGESRLMAIRGRRRVRARKLSFQDRGFARSFIVLDELTKELLASEKAAYEKLIRTMSHEVNNTSGAVISLLESCLTYGGQISAADRADFDAGMAVAISRTRHMNEFMKGFADVVRLPLPDRKSGSVEDVLRRTARLLEPESAKRRIVWHWSVDPDFPPVRLDATQMEQAFLNIFRNSFEAIGESGEITVTLSANGGRPALLIEDTGGGIPPGIGPKLFTSFFTSKPGGQGIGLTLVQEILLAHGFDFRLETVAPGRAGFRVEFPPG